MGGYMSYRPHQSAFALLTGAIAPNTTSNASPSDKSTTLASWVTMPTAATEGVTCSTSILMMGFPTSTTACRARIGDLSVSGTTYREACDLTVYGTATNYGLGYDSSDDEILIYRSAPAVVKVGNKQAYTTTVPYQAGPRWDSVYPRFCVWRMS